MRLAQNYMIIGRSLPVSDCSKEEARAFHQKAEPLYIWLEENTREDAKSYRTLFDIYFSLGQINLRKQQYNAAEVYFQRAGEIAGKMTDVSDIDYKRLSEGYKCLEQINYEKGETEKAKIFCEQSAKYKEYAESWNRTLKRTLKEWTELNVKED